MKGRRIVALWCAVCRAFVDIEGAVFDAAPATPIHVTPADWLPHRRLHPAGAR